MTSLRLGSFPLHPLPLTFPPGALADFVRTGLRAVALIGLPQIDALAFLAAGQGGGILGRHQVKIRSD